MPFTSILTHVSDDEESSHRLRLARDLAVSFGCELIGGGAEVPELYLSSRGLAWPRPGYRLHDAELEIAARLARQSDKFAVAEGIGKIAHRWMAGIAEPAVFLAANARGADLIIASRPTPDSLTCNFPVPANLILSAARPVLLAPEGKVAPHFENIIVGWKDTREARRALLDALPFLQRASNVTIVAVHEADDREQTDAALTDVVRRLVMLGVESKAKILDPARHGAASAFLAFADKEHTDLLVVGAYGHSRLRELVLGGFTESLLSAPRPVLFSH